MKKIVRLLFLGLLSISVLSPTAVKAVEDQSVAEDSSSVYSQNMGISPLATPYKTQVTLDNGESYEFTKKYAYFADDYHPPYTQIIAESPEDEISLIEISLVGSTDPQYTIQNLRNNTFNIIDLYLPNTPGNYYFPEVNYKITNYSPGRVTYDLTVRFGMIQPT